MKDNIGAILYLLAIVLYGGLLFGGITYGFIQMREVAARHGK